MPGAKRAKKHQSSDEEEASESDGGVEERKLNRAQKKQTKAADKKSEKAAEGAADQAGNGKHTTSGKTARQMPTTEGEVVSWLSTPSVPLADKLAAASAAMSASGSDVPVSGRLASAVLQFAANAVLHSCPSSSFAGLTASTSVALGPRKKDDAPARTPNHLNPALWHLIHQSLLASPYSLAGVIGSIGPHICRPMHACLAHALMHVHPFSTPTETKSQPKRSKTMPDGAKGSVGKGAAAEEEEHAGMLGRTGAVKSILSALLLLRSHHCDAFRPPIASLTSMLGHVIQLYASRLRVGLDDTWTKDIVLEVIACTTTHLVAAPSARKVFGLVVDELVAPAALLLDAVGVARMGVARMRAEEEEQRKKDEDAEGGGGRGRKEVGAWGKEEDQEEQSAAGEEQKEGGLEVLRRCEALLATSFFGGSSLAEYGMAFSFRREEDGAKPAEEEGEGGPKKGKRGDKKGVYRGNKIKSYQTALFDKLKQLGAEGCGVGEMKLDPARAVAWLPRVLRMFLHANDAVNKEHAPNANAQEASDGKKKKGGGGSSMLGMDFLRELLHILDRSSAVHARGGEKREEEEGGEKEGKKAKGKKRKAEEEEEKAEEKEGGGRSGAAVKLEVERQLLELIIEFDVYRVHSQGEGEAKEFLRQRADAMAAEIADKKAPAMSAEQDDAKRRRAEEEDANAGGKATDGDDVVQDLVLHSARVLLLLDHSVVEQHAMALLMAAMRGVKRRQDSILSGASVANQHRAQSAGVQFVCALCKTYRKLNQMDRFMEWFLQAIATHPCPQVDISADETLAFLSRSLRAAAWGELPSLWEHALNKISSELLPKVLRLRTAEEWEENSMLAMLHVMQVVEMLGMAAHAVADGADSTALEDLSRRTAQQAVAPLLGIAQKALKSKDQRAWASYVLASILRVQAALSSLYVVLPDAVKAPGFQGEDEPAGRLFWLAGIDDDFASLVSLLTKPSGPATPTPKKGALQENGSLKEGAWCALSPPSLAGAVTRAACRSLQGCERRLWQPLVGHEVDQASVSTARELSQMLLQQYLLSCRRLGASRVGRKRKDAESDEAARLVVKLIGSQLPLVVELAAETTDTKVQEQVWDAIFQVVEDQGMNLLASSSSSSSHPISRASTVLDVLSRESFYEVASVREGMLPCLVLRIRSLVAAMMHACDAGATDANEAKKEAKATKEARRRMAARSGWADGWQTWATGALDSIHTSLKQGSSAESFCWSMKPKHTAESDAEESLEGPCAGDESAWRLAAILRVLAAVPPGYLSVRTRAAMMLGLAAAESATVASRGVGKVGSEAARGLVCASRRVLVHLCTGGDVVDEDQSAGIVGHVRRGGWVMLEDLKGSVDGNAIEWLVGAGVEWAGPEAALDTAKALERMGQGIGARLLQEEKDEGAVAALQVVRKVLWKQLEDTNASAHGAASVPRAAAIVHGVANAIGEEEGRCRKSKGGQRSQGEAAPAPAPTFKPAGELVSFLQDLCGLAAQHLSPATTASNGKTNTMDVDEKEEKEEEDDDEEEEDAEDEEEGADARARKGGLLGIVGSVMLAQALLRSKRCKSDPARAFAKTWGALGHDSKLVRWAVREAGAAPDTATGVGNGAGLYLYGLCAAYGRLAPAVSEDDFRELVALLVGAAAAATGEGFVLDTSGSAGPSTEREVAPAEDTLAEETGGWLACCFRHLLSFASREQLGVLGKMILTDIQQSISGSFVPWQHLHGLLLLTRSALQAVTPDSRRWQLFLPSMPPILALLPALASHLLNASQRPRLGSTLVEAWWSLSAAELCCAASAAVASLLRREQQIALDPRAVQCGLHLALAVVLAIADAGWTSARNAPGERARAHLDDEPAVTSEWKWGAGGTEVGASVQSPAVRAIMERDFRTRCRLMDSAYHILHATVTRRPREVSSLMPCILQCIDRYLRFLLNLSAEAALLDAIKASDDLAFSARSGAAHHSSLHADMLEVARNLARLLEGLAAEKKRFNKYAVHVLLLHMHITEHHPSAWPQSIKDALLPGIFAAIDACGQYELQQVFGMLSVGARPLFQSLCADFKRSYKYVGEA